MVVFGWVLLLLLVMPSAVEYPTSTAGGNKASLVWDVVYLNTHHLFKTIILRHSPLPESSEGHHCLRFHWQWTVKEEEHEERG